MSDARVERLFEDGLTALRKEQYSRAHDYFSEVMDLDPGLPQVHYNLGLAAANLFCWEDARDAFNMALRIQPHPDFWIHLGLTHLHLRNWQEALVSFESALEMDSHSEVALAHKDDLLIFLNHDKRSAESIPNLCYGWFDSRLQNFVGVDPEIIVKARRAELRSYLSEYYQQGKEKCDHSHRFTEQWSLENGLDPLGVSRFLYSRGMRCDCEVLAESMA